MKTCLFCKAEIPSSNNPRARKPKLYCNSYCKFKAWKQSHKERYKLLVTEKNKQYLRARKEIWKQKGLCLKCGRTRAENSKWCLKCLEYSKNYYLFAKNKKVKELNKDSAKINNRKIYKGVRLSTQRGNYYSNDRGNNNTRMFAKRRR